jgi:hypothetical protein
MVVCNHREIFTHLYFLCIDSDHKIKFLMKTPAELAISFISSMRREESMAVLVCNGNALVHNVIGDRHGNR